MGHYTAPPRATTGDTKKTVELRLDHSHGHQTLEEKSQWGKRGQYLIPSPLPVQLPTGPLEPRAPAQPEVSSCPDTGGEVTRLLSLLRCAGPGKSWPQSAAPHGPGADCAQLSQAQVGLLSPGRRPSQAGSNPAQLHCPWQKKALSSR